MEDSGALVEHNNDGLEIGDGENIGRNGHDEGQTASSQWTESENNSSWEIAEKHSVLGPVPTAEEKAAEVIPTAAKELHTYYMIRIPKPADNKGKAEIRMVELRIKEKAENRDFINAALQMKRASRNEAASKLRAAREKVRACGDATRQKKDEIEPLQGALRKLKDTGRQARDKSRDLPASEQELDNKIAYFEHRIEHESIPLKEEKQLLRDIKNLRASREEVCANEALHTEFSESLREREDIQNRLKPLISELEALKGEWTMASEKVKAAEAELEKMEIALNQVQEQWAAANKARQDAYDERAALIRQENARNADFYMNRQEIQHVKQLAFNMQQKMVEELCNAQVERVMNLWNNNAEFRAAYVKSNERSTLKRLQTFDGRALGHDEEPPLIPGDREDVPLDTQTETRASAFPAKPLKEPSAVPSQFPLSSTSDVQGKQNGFETTILSDQNSRAIDDRDAFLSSQEEQRKEDLAAAAKLKEKRREQEMAKAREAEERKRRAAEKSQSKALARAKKEAEKREKEKEKKAQKKAAVLSSSTQGISPAAEAVNGEMQEVQHDVDCVRDVPPEIKRRVNIRQLNRPSQKPKTARVPLASSLSKKEGVHLPPWFWIAGPIVLLGIFALLWKFVV